jgi:hypothetical protein
MLSVAPGASVKMGKVQAPPKLNVKKFTGMQFETAARESPLPKNLEKPFFIQRSPLIR